MACTAQTLVNAACEGGYDGLQDRQLQEAIAYLMCSGGGGSGQIKQYLADPTSEGVVPANQDLPAVCYPQNGIGTVFTWNTTTHAWQ